MRLTALPREIRELARVSRVAGGAYGERRLSVARRARGLRLRGGWTYEEALSWGLLDPDMPESERGAWVSTHARHSAERRHNPPSIEPFTEDKLTFHAYCRTVGIPTPRLFGAIGRAGGWSATSGRIIPDADSFASMVADELPDEFVTKPVRGMLGLGVRVLRRDGDRLTGLGEAGHVDARALHRAIVEDDQFDLHLVQERLHNGPEVDDLHPSDVLQTLRLSTFVAPDGSVHVLNGWMKFSIGAGAADNYAGGTTGNGVALLRLEDGTMDPLTLDRPDRLGFQRVATMPATGRRIEGEPVPFFQEACALVRDGAPRFMPMRTLGWDIALTADGPVVLETNGRWGSPLGAWSDEARRLYFGP
jgi:hypothetical protein